MIFEPAQRVSLPAKDLLSYTFDNPRYDQDEPVRSSYLGNIDQLADFVNRSMSMLAIHRGRFLATRRES